MLIQPLQGHPQQLLLGSLDTEILEVATEDNLRKASLVYFHVWSMCGGVERQGVLGTGLTRAHYDHSVDKPLLVYLASC